MATIETPAAESLIPIPPRGMPHLDRVVSLIALGSSFLASVLALGILLLAYKMADSLLTPNSFAQTYVNAITSVITSDAKGGRDASELATLALSADYASMGFRIKAMQVAFGTLIGAVLVVVGLSLFALGATGTMAISGRHNDLNVRVVASSPGIAMAIMGSIVIALSLTIDVGSFSAARSRAEAEVGFTGTPAPNARQRGPGSGAAPGVPPHSTGARSDDVVGPPQVID